MGDNPESLIRAIGAVCAKVDSIPKSGKNLAQKYSYAELEDYIDTIGDLLTESGLIITTSIDKAKHYPPIQTRSGGFLYPCAVWGQMTAHLNGESLSIGITGYAQNSGDKAVYAAITGARKYGLAQLFNLVTKDDPEKFSDGDYGAAAKHKGKPRPNERKPEPNSENFIRKEIRERIMKMYGAEDYAKNLKRLSEFTGKDGKKKYVETLADPHLTAGWLATLRGKVSKEYHDWEKEQKK